MSTAPKIRELPLACPSCSSRTLLVQTAQGDEWMPTLESVMVAQGWSRATDGAYACSKNCIKIRNADNPFQVSGDEAFRRSVARGDYAVYPRNLAEAAARGGVRQRAPFRCTCCPCRALECQNACSGRQTVPGRSLPSP